MTDMSTLERLHAAQHLPKAYLKHLTVKARSAWMWPCGSSSQISTSDPVKT